MNIKNERIKKLWLSGVKDTQKIAKKLGLPNDERVIQGLKWLQDRQEISGFIQEKE